MLPRLSLSRLSLIIATLFAANLSLAETPAASAPFTLEQQQLIRQISASEAQSLIPQVASAAAVNVEKSIAGEKQAIEVAKEALEVGRKSVDWWLSNIGVLMALFGLVLTAAAFGIPYAMGLKKKAEWQEKLADITEKLKQAEAAQQQAEKHASEIEKLRNSAQEKASLIPNAEQLTGKLSDDLLEKLRAEKPPQVVKLIQQAWEAHEKENWPVAKPLWELLSLIESQDANVWFNLAFAEQHSGTDWQRICDAYRCSHLLASSAIACNNWGIALSDWANTLTGELQQQRFAEADRCYIEATRLQLDYAEAYYNWGIALSDWANTLTGELQQQRFAEADRHYAEAIRLKPDYADTYYNWGSALIHLAHTLQSPEREAKLAQAEEKLLLAKEKGNKNPYNLACLRAVQQRTEEARALLKEARSAGFLPDHAHLSSDKDLENLRELDWFKDLLSEVQQEEAQKATVA